MRVPRAAYDEANKRIVLANLMYKFESVRRTGWRDSVAKYYNKFELGVLKEGDLSRETYGSFSTGSEVTCQPAIATDKNGRIWAAFNNRNFRQVNDNEMPRRMLDELVIVSAHRVSPCGGGKAITGFQSTCLRMTPFPPASLSARLLSP